MSLRSLSFPSMTPLRVPMQCKFVVVVITCLQSASPAHFFEPAQLDHADAPFFRALRNKELANKLGTDLSRQLPSQLSPKVKAAQGSSTKRARHLKLLSFLDYIFSHPWRGKGTHEKVTGLGGQAPAALPARCEWEARHPQAFDCHTSQHHCTHKLVLQRLEPCPLCALLLSLKGASRPPSAHDPSASIRHAPGLLRTLLHTATILSTRKHQQVHRGLSAPV
jgi:hypothetical protein